MYATYKIYALSNRLGMQYNKAKDLPVHEEKETLHNVVFVHQMTCELWHLITMQ